MKVTALIICILPLSFTPWLYVHTSAEQGSERPKSPIHVITDKTDYYTGEVVKIDGHVPTLTDGREVNIIVKDANGETFIKLRIKPTDSKFVASFQIPLYYKPLPIGKWTIEVSYAIWVTRVDINVLAGEQEALHSISILKLGLINLSEPARDIRVGNKVMIISEVKNNVERYQHIFYIVQVKDDLGTNISLDWVVRTLAAKETVKLSATWTPELEGKYTVETFVWDDINDPTPLSPSQNVSLTVAR